MYEAIKSDLWRLGTNDLVKGLVLAVIVAFLDYLYQVLNATGGHVNLSDVWHVVLLAVVGYLIKNFATDRNGKIVGM
jgi:hypothetical protein